MELKSSVYFVVGAHWVGLKKISPSHKASFRSFGVWAFILLHLNLMFVYNTRPEVKVHFSLMLIATSIYRKDHYFFSKVHGACVVSQETVYVCGSFSRLSILFQWSICLSLGQYQNVLINEFL